MPADLLTSWAFEMETLILGWYVMVNTGSVLLLTAFASLQFLGSLAAPMFGVLGGRLGGAPVVVHDARDLRRLRRAADVPRPQRDADAGVGVRHRGARRHRAHERSGDA